MLKTLFGDSWQLSAPHLDALLAAAKLKPRKGSPFPEFLSEHRKQTRVDAKELEKKQLLKSGKVIPGLLDALQLACAPQARVTYRGARGDEVVGFAIASTGSSASGCIGAEDKLRLGKPVPVKDLIRIQVASLATGTSPRAPMKLKGPQFKELASIAALLAKKQWAGSITSKDATETATLQKGLSLGVLEALKNGVYKPLPDALAMMQALASNAVDVWSTLHHNAKGDPDGMRTLMIFAPESPRPVVVWHEDPAAEQVVLETPDMMGLVRAFAWNWFLDVVPPPAQSASAPGR